MELLRQPDDPSSRNLRDSQGRLRVAPAAHLDDSSREPFDDGVDKQRDKAVGVGDMWFLAIFGKNVEDAFGRIRYAALYAVGCFVATARQTTMTLIGGTAADARVPVLGAIAAVLGAYFVLYPESRILTLVLVFPVRIRAWVFLGLWFLYQFVMANWGFFSASANGGGTAFFAHVGGFVFGVAAAVTLVRSRERQGRLQPVL
jgi:membrane associated rhomboid family serine protease